MELKEWNRYLINFIQLIIGGDDVKRLQKQMEELFLRQKEKGGIRDLEEEGRKYLVLTSTNESGEMGQLSPTDFLGSSLFSSR